MTSTSHPLDDEAPGFVLSLLKFWRSSLLIIVGATALAFAVSLILPKSYTSFSHIGLVDPQNTDVFAVGGRVPEDFERYTARQVGLAGSGSVLAAGAETLDRPVEELYEAVTVEAGEVAGDVYIFATGDTGAEAADTANAVMEAYRSAVRNETQRQAEERIAAIDQSRVELQNDIDEALLALEADPFNTVLQGQINGAIQAQASLSDRANQIRVNADNFGDGIDLLDPAREPGSPTDPQPLRNAGIGLLLGFLVAGAVSWVRADRFRTVDHEEPASLIARAPVLGAVPTLTPDQELAGVTDGGSVPGEAYQLVTASLRHVFKAGVLLITSASRGDGKTISSASLATAAARAGTRVVLVDGDVRACGLTGRLLGTERRRTTGLTDVAVGTSTLDAVVRRMALPDDVPLDFVPAGSAPTNAAGLYRTTRVADAMRELRERYDLVIVDCPAALAVADVLSLAMHADGILLVVRRGSALRHLEAVRDRLNLVDAPLIGCVFTRARLDEGVYEYADPAANGKSPRRWRLGRQPGPGDGRRNGGRRRRRRTGQRDEALLTPSGAARPDAT